MGEIHDPRDAVLERQPHGDQRIHAAENEPGRDCGNEHVLTENGSGPSRGCGGPKSNLSHSYCFHAGFGTTTAAMPGPAGATPV